MYHTHDMMAEQDQQQLRGGGSPHPPLNFNFQKRDFGKVKRLFSKDGSSLGASYIMMRPKM